MKLAILIVCVVVMAIELKIFFGQGHKLSKLKLEKRLVESITGMEKTILAHTVRTADKTQLSKVEFIFRGTIFKNGIPYALIDDMVYAEGDSIGEYTVARITRNGTTLENKFTREIRKLYFQE